MTFWKWGREDRIAFGIPEPPDKNGGWISVEERLPDVGEHVLLWDSKSRTEVTGSRAIAGQLTEWMDVWDGELYIEPTHWMPLPEPPK